jgi:two-component system response regulator RegX3
LDLQRGHAQPKGGDQVRIALLEDNFDYGQLLGKWLREEGHTCEHCSCSNTFIRTLQRESFDMLILDWVMPELSGIEVLRWARENLDWRIPILFVTVMDRQDNLVEALDTGADDYMIKPVAKAELIARITALSRRAGIAETQGETLEFAPFHFNEQGREVFRDGSSISLTRKEFELCLFFYRNIGRVLSRGNLLQSVRGRSPEVNTRTIDTHISRLRSKLDLSPSSGWRLSSIYQHGYRLDRLSLTSALVPSETSVPVTEPRFQPSSLAVVE